MFLDRRRQCGAILATLSLATSLAVNSPASAQGVDPARAAASASAPAAQPVAEVSGGASSMIETQRVAVPAAGPGAKVRRGPVETPPPRSLAIGEVATINLPSVSRIAIGNGHLVKATVVDDNQIVLLAEAAGDTTMHVWLRGGRQLAYTLHVAPERADRLLADLTKYIAGAPGLHVQTVGERIVIEGRYPDAETASRIKALTNSFPQVLNLVAARPADADPLQLDRMVQLNMRVIEVKKTALDQLGIKWASGANGPTFATNALGYANTPYRPDGATLPTVTTSHPIATYFGLATQITSALAFLEERGDAWTLAEPQLSCRSGGESKFTAGGEIPIPVAQGLGAVSVYYKPYGVLVEFKPVADGNGNVDSHILIEVSEPDSRNSNQGFVAFTTNRAESQVALREGEPLVIAGLLRQKTEKSSDAIPGLGHIPLLSHLFGEHEKRTEQTELFLIVVPRVVVPQSVANRDSMVRAQGLSGEAGKAAAETYAAPPSRFPTPAISPAQSAAATSPSTATVPASADAPSAVTAPLPAASSASAASAPPR